MRKKKKQKKKRENKLLINIQLIIYSVRIETLTKQELTIRTLCYQQ